MDSVLITGASSGFGLETALYLAARGFQVYATAPVAAELPAIHAAADLRGVSLTALPLDVTDEGSIASAVDEVGARAGGLYGLVNNAGLGQRGCFEDVTEAELRRLFDVNFFGALAVTRRVLPHMRAARRGRVIGVSSVAGRVASFGLSSYCATKFALEGFGEALALEVAPFGLHSILIEPGIVKTPHWSINRGTTQRAFDPSSPYAEMLARHEEIADRRTATSRITPTHVAQAVHKALTAPRPRMRYIVGRPATLVILLRRYVPNALFERIYFGLLLRQITRTTPAQPTTLAAAEV